MFLPLILLYHGIFGSGPALYKMDEGGNPQKLILDENKLTNAMAFSQVHQSDKKLFVGTPFAGNMFVLSNDD